MKSLSKFALLTLSVLFLSACESKVNITPTESSSILEVYTAAAMTLTAQSPSVTLTMTLLPTVTPTIWPSPTLVLSTPTTQNVSISYSTANGCYNAAYISDVTIPDGTVLAPDEAFTKTWKFQNTGSCDWTEDFWIIFSSGEDIGGDDTEFDGAVAAGDTESISVSLVAPDDEGTYTGYWRLETEDGTVFGETVYVLIVVSDDAATSTPTAPATTAATETTTATPTPTSTYTPVPTATTDTSYPNP